MAETTGELTGTKKIVALSLTGVVIAIAIGAAFVPSIRDYAVNISKVMMEGIKAFL